MTIAALLKAGLANDSGVSAIVGTRIYPRKLPQHPTYPALTYQRISNGEQNGTSNRRETRWQINCWAETDVGSTTLAAAVKAFAEDWYDVSATPSIEYARVGGEYDDYDEDTKSYRNIVDLILITKGD